MWRLASAFVLGVLAGFLAGHRTGPALPPAASVTAAEAGTQPLRDPMRPATSRRSGREADAQDAPAGNAAAGASGVPPPDLPQPRDEAHALLAQIEAEVRSPSPPNTGFRTVELAGRYSTLPNPPPRVDIGLVRTLFGKRDHFPQAGRVLIRFVEPSVAVGELRRMTAAGTGGAWQGAQPGEIPAALAVVAAQLLGDEDVRSLLGAPDAVLRRAGVKLAIERNLVSPADLLELSRTDRDLDVARTAFDALVAGIRSGRSDRAVVVAEVLRLVRAPDDRLQETAIHRLGSIGPEGTAAAAELISSGGVPPGLVDSLSETLIAGGRIDALSRAPLSGESLRRMLSSLQQSFDLDDAPIDPAAVATVLRAIPLPDDAEAAESYFAVALLAGAPDLVLGTASRRDVSGRVRIYAAAAFFEGARRGPFAESVSAARAVLDETPVDASRRREFLEWNGIDVVRASDAGRALVARVAEHDPDPWVRRTAAQAIRDADD